MRHTILVLVVVLIGLICLARPPIAQDLAYHLMADQRTLLGVPNFFNVLSNLPFLFVALLGLAAVSAVAKWARLPFPTGPRQQSQSPSPSERDTHLGARLNLQAGSLPCSRWHANA